MKTPNNLTICDHPLLKHFLTIMRDGKCPGAQFRYLTNQMATFLTYEAMPKLNLKLDKVGGKTPTGHQFSGEFIDSSAVALVSLMRTAMTMGSTVHELLPNALICHAGYHSKSKSGELKSWFQAVPDLTDKYCLVYDSAFVTGGSISALLSYLVEHKNADYQKLVVVTIIASEPSMQLINETHGERVQVVAAAYDPKIYKDDNRSYTIPGVGSFHERLFGHLVSPEERFDGR